MSDALDLLNSLDLPQLKILQGAIEKQITARESTILEELPTSLEDLKIPSYVLITYVELVYIAFIEELFKNYSEDFAISDPTIYDDNNNIKVSSPYNKLDFKDGQYPKIIVQADNSSLMKQFVGNQSPYQTGTIGSRTQSQKSAYFSVPVTINIFTQNYHQGNILGNIVQMSVMQNQDTIRSLFGFEAVAAPAMSPSRKVREYDNVFMASVNFAVNKYVQWSQKLSLQDPQSLIVRLIAKVNSDDPDTSIKHVLGVFTSQFGNLNI